MYHSNLFYTYNIIIPLQHKYFKLSKNILGLVHPRMTKQSPLLVMDQLDCELKIYIWAQIMFIFQQHHP